MTSRAVLVRLAVILDGLAFPWRCALASRLRGRIHAVCLLAGCGTGLKIKHGVIIDDAGGITIGRNVGIGEYSFLSGNGGITVGDDVMIGHHVSIVSASHNFGSLAAPMNRQGLSLAAVVIGSDVWIGAGARILPGVTIGSGAIVGANAVVTGDVPERAVVAGVPARVVAQRPG